MTVHDQWKQNFLPDFQNEFSNPGKLIEKLSKCYNRLWTWTTEEFILLYQSGNESCRKMLEMMLFTTAHGWQVPANWFKMSWNERNAFHSIQWDIYKPRPEIAVLNPTQYAMSQGHVSEFYLLEEGRLRWEEYEVTGLDQLFYYSEI